MDVDVNNLIGALPGVIWITYQDGSLRYVNGSWCHFTAVTAEQAAGQGWQKTVHPEDLPRLLNCWREITASGNSREIEARLLRGSRRLYYWFLIRMSPLQGTPGCIVHWCGTYTDLDEISPGGPVPGVRWWTSRYGREVHFRAIADGFPVMSCLMTPQGVLEQVNDKTLEFFGMTLEELRAAPLSRTIHPDDQQRVIDFSNNSGIAGQPYEYEVRLRRSDGQYRWFHLAGLPLRDETGRIVLWHFQQTDVHDRRHAEALLSVEKELLKMIAEGSALPLILERLCHLLDSLTETYTTGVTLLDPAVGTLRQLVSPGLPSTLREQFTGADRRIEMESCKLAAALKSPVIVSDIESDPRWHGSSWRSLALTYDLRSCWSSPMVSRAGDLLGTFFVYQHNPARPDASDQALIQQFSRIAAIAIERSQKEEQLRRSEAFLVKAQQVSETGSYFWRAATDEMTVSEQFMRIFNFDPDDRVSIGRIASRLHPEDLHKFSDNVEQARQGRGEFEFECRLLMPDKSVKYVSFAHGPAAHSGGLEYVGAVQDIGKRRNAEDALNEVRSELARVTRVMSLGTLAASIAHEINQPLSGTITNAGTCVRMLGADPPNVSGARTAAGRIIRDGNRAADVVNRLRSLFGNRPPAADLLNLNDITREVLELADHEIQKGRIAVRTEFDQALPAVTGDRIQLQQVILNLLLNAAEAMSVIHDRTRQLLIKTERDEEGAVRFSMRDTGVGFVQDSMQKIFQAFFTTKATGMGIGLSVSRSIVQAHGGTLWAVSNEGPGATFCFSIPGCSGFSKTSPELATILPHRLPDANTSNPG